VTVDDSAPKPPLRPEDAQRVISQMTGTEVVLVGGQAVNVWSEIYASSEPRLQSYLPVTSKDVDYQGTATAVADCAQRINGCAVRSPAFNDGRLGHVKWVDPLGFQREVDFLDSVSGLRRGEVASNAVPVEQLGVLVQVIDPVRCMISRAHNVIRIARKYDNPHGNAQLEASVLCAGVFIRKTLDEGYPKVAGRSIVRLLEFAHTTTGRRLLQAKGIDPLNVIPIDSRYDARLRRIHFPRTLAKILADRHRRRVRRNASGEPGAGT
jgi:hypothetical protein